MRSFLISMLLLCSCSWSHETLRLLVAVSIPPYIIKESNSGIELDIVRASLGPQGYRIQPVYVPGGRLRANFEKDSIDGSFTTNENAELPAFYSDEYICFQNSAVSLEEDSLKIDTVADLVGKRIIAWQDARIYMGEAYQKSIELAESYYELANQINQVNMLYIKRCEVIIIDINIFKYLSNTPSKIPKDAPVIIHDIFPKTCYKIAFKEERHVRDFNKGLTALKSNNEYQKIIDSYILKK